MKPIFLIITSIANSDHPVLKHFAGEALKHQIPFIIIGDTKSPANFQLEGCDFYSVEKQHTLDWELARAIPYKHYARKNLGYLIAISKGAEIIIETDDDNLPFNSFWDERICLLNTHNISNKGWVNIYKYFTDKHIWPRGFALNQILNELPPIGTIEQINCPIQQGLADENPDIDAIYRLTLPLPLFFKKNESIALGENTWCPFNSQNTTWFKEAFPLLYLPSCCSFRMTDIWRSFIAQRVAWTCDWHILFHSSTVKQERNNHNLMIDFNDEIPGYLNNNAIADELQKLNLKRGPEYINDNLYTCYETLVKLNIMDQTELRLLSLWMDALGKL
jgi:hypothetical protein